MNHLPLRVKSLNDHQSLLLANGMLLRIQPERRNGDVCASFYRIV